MMLHRRALILLYSVLCLFLISCVTASMSHGPASSYAAGSEFAEAVYFIEKNQNELYTKNDLVLKSLDIGLLSHYNRDFKYSSMQLSEAERLMYEYYTKSVSQSITSFLLNDNVIDYAGDPYEDIYTNLFMALNYASQGNIDSAFVEIRRFDNKQKELSLTYQGAIQEAKHQVAAGNEFSGNVEFHNSALARYISMLLYRSEGMFDSAEIDYKYMQSAFATQRSIYDFPIPSSVKDELSVPRGKGRLNVLSFTGLAPVKHEEIVRFATEDTYFKLAIPVMQKQNSTVHAIEVEILSYETGVTNNIRLEKIESIENIALDTFKQKQTILYIKAAARALAKSSTTAIFDDQAGRHGGEVGLLFSVLKIASAVSNEVTEKADIRTSRYFPASASVGGISLDPGTYLVMVRYLDYSGRTISVEEFPGVKVQPDTLNLLESVCLN